MDWFRKLTGLADDKPATVRAGLGVVGTMLLCPNGRRMQAGRLLVPSLAELPAAPKGEGRLTLREVVGDVRDLHADPANEGALFQVASQFNLLEMVGPSVTPEAGIAGYALDRTQGPVCAMACAAGTIWRNYLVPLGDQIGQSAGRQIDTLADLQEALGPDLWRMQNGYALPRPGGLEKVAASLRPGMEGLLRIGLQADTEVTLPGAGHLVHQAYASALPMAYAGGASAAWEPFARLVLNAAYRATLAAALELGTSRVFLTRLGGGAFGNPDPWITEAIAGALTEFAAAPLEVVLVSYGPSRLNRPLLKEGLAWKVASR
jgi:hypothetical protein